MTCTASGDMHDANVLPNRLSRCHGLLGKEAMLRAVGVCVRVAHVVSRQLPHLDLCERIY